MNYVITYTRLQVVLNAVFGRGITSTTELVPEHESFDGLVFRTEVVARSDCADKQEIARLLATHTPNEM
jgi:hypothetical protein